MTDVRGSVVVCNDTCGCPPGCPGIACRCISIRSTGVVEEEIEHKRCSCGEHCSCNPCTCSKADITGSGRASCSCGPGCTCVTCAS